MKEFRSAFFALLDASPEDRPQLLASLAVSQAERAMLAKMIAADGAAHALLDGDAQAIAGALRVPEPLLPPPKIGDEVGTFRIVGELGAGGSSHVFLGERPAGSGLQRVAIKVLRTPCHDEHERATFDREVEILARLRHGDIARLIEAGVAISGAPFIAMEYFDGVPITTAARDARLNLGARLRLFVRLCRAISAAHAALVVHRDIKPANVLLGREGDLRIVDFGVAAILHETAKSWPASSLRLTPEYAAPEQFERNGGHGVSVDVYALGVLLGELVTGTRASEVPLSTIAAGQKVSPEGLPAPAKLARLLKGDIDAIVAKATALRPEERYLSVEALADDVARHLEIEPLAIRHDQRAYVLATHLRRWRGPIAAVSVVFIALATLSVAVSHNARRAAREAVRADAVRDFVVEIFSAAKAALPKDVRPSPRELAQAARARIDASALDVATRAEVELALGEMLLSMSEPIQAQQSFATALSLLGPDANHDKRVAAMRGLAESLQSQGKNDEALSALTALQHEIGEGTIEDELEQLRIESTARMELAQFDKATELTQRAADKAAQAFGDDDLKTLHARAEVGAALAITGKFKDGLALLRPLRQRWDVGGRPHDWQYAAMLQNLAVCEFETGNSQAAIATFEAVLVEKRKIYDPPHESLAVTHRTLATVQNLAGRYAEAIDNLNIALSMQRQLLGDNHVETLKTRDALSSPLQRVGRVAEAEQEFRIVLAACVAQTITDDICARTEQNYGQLNLNQGQPLLALPHLEMALQRRTRMFGPDHANVASVLARLATVNSILGHRDTALEQARRAFATFERLGRANSREGVLASDALARALADHGRFAEALTRIDAVIANWSDGYGDARMASYYCVKARVLVGLRREDEARQWIEKARALAARSGGASPLLTKEMAAVARELKPS